MQKPQLEMTIRPMLRTVDVYTVSRILGHQSLEATLVYLHANDARMKAQLRPWSRSLHPNLRITLELPQAVILRGRRLVGNRARAVERTAYFDAKGR